MPRPILTRHHLLVMAAAILAFSGGALAMATELAVELDRSGVLAPADVHYVRTDRGLRIDGRIEKRVHRYGRIGGHAEIELLDADGRVLSRQAAPLQRFMPRRKNPDWASFQATIPDPPADAARIRVSHRDGGRAF